MKRIISFSNYYPKFRFPWHRIIAGNSHWILSNPFQQYLCTFSLQRGKLFQPVSSIHNESLRYDVSFLIIIHANTTLVYKNYDTNTSTLQNELIKKKIPPFCEKYDLTCFLWFLNHSWSSKGEHRRI